MARPIKDAKRFREAMENVESVSKKRMEEIKKSYELFKSIATFPLP
jgi:hypothetical protein